MTQLAEGPFSSTGNAPPGGRLLRAALLAVLCLTALATLLYVRAYSVEFPLLDDWDIAIEQLPHLAAHSLSWSDINLQHSDSIILFPQMVSLAAAKLVGYRVLVIIYISYSFLCGSLWLLFRFFRVLDLRGRWSLLWFLPVSVFFLGWRQSEGLLWGTQLLNTMSLFFSLLALYGCLRAYRSFGLFAVAILSAWAASFSMASGRLTWVVGWFCLAVLGRPESRAIRRRYVISWSLFAGACGACFFRDRVSYSEDWPTGVPYVLSNSGAAVRYGLTYLGSPFTHEAGKAIYFGAILAVIAALTVFLTVRMTLRQEGAAGALVLIALVILALGALLTGRLGMGPEQALASRYVTLGNLAPIGVYFCLLALRNETRLARYLIAAMAALFLLGTFDSYSKGLEEGRESRAYDNRCAGIVRHFRQHELSDLECAYPDPQVILERAPFLERHRLSLFH